ncbi:hypothetical protein EJ110_NYTH10829 [Nymphaea thermarum]|nr:hypothetical protein EJ110_NYTH10829 [Nymphaea thermarum]
MAKVAKNVWHFLLVLSVVLLLPERGKGNVAAAKNKQLIFGLFDVPKAALRNVALKKVTTKSVTLQGTVVVNNPNFFRIPIGEVPFAFKSSGRVIASGVVPNQGSLPAWKETTFDVPVEIPYSIVKTMTMDIAGDGDIDYELDVTLKFRMPIIGKMITIPLNKSGEINIL